MTTTPPVVESMLSAKDELIAEAAAAIPPSVWMDISTAPKDGTLVQLWGKYWSDGQGMMKEPLVGNWMRERWEVWGPGGRFGIRPTHWTNLPTPPKAPTP